MAEDYINFVSDLKGYTSSKISFNRTEESKWRYDSQFTDGKSLGTYPIGRLEKEGDSIEIFFLHYHSE